MPQIAQQDWIRIPVDFLNSFAGNYISDEAIAAPLRRAAKGGTIYDVLLVGQHPYLTDLPDVEVKILGFTYSDATSGRITFIMPHLDPDLSFADFSMTEPQDGGDDGGGDEPQVA